MAQLKRYSILKATADDQLAKLEEQIVESCQELRAMRLPGAKHSSGNLIR